MTKEVSCKPTKELLKKGNALKGSRDNCVRDAAQAPEIKLEIEEDHVVDYVKEEVHVVDYVKEDDHVVDYVKLISFEELDRDLSNYSLPDVSLSLFGTSSSGSDSSLSDLQPVSSEASVGGEELSSHNEAEPESLRSSISAEDMESRHRAA